MTLSSPERVAVSYEPRGASRDLFANRDAAVIVDGPAGCVAGETRIYDAEIGAHVAIRDLYDGRLAPMVLTLDGPVRATVPFRKGMAPLFRFTLLSGKSCVVTGDHRLLTPLGWCDSAALTPGRKILAGDPIPVQSTSASGPSAWRPDVHGSTQTVAGYLRSCDPSRRQYDPQPRSVEGDDRARVPSQGGVLSHSRDDWHVDVQGDGSGHTRPYHASGHLSMPGCWHRPDESAYGGSRVPAGTYQRVDALCQSDALYRPTMRHQQPSLAQDQYCDSRHHQSIGSDECHCGAGNCGPADRISEVAPQQGRYSELADRQQESAAAARSSTVVPCSASLEALYTAQWDTVQSIEYVRTDEYFDLHVPGTEHYLAEGIWHHNTGKSRGCLEKINACALKYPGMRALLLRKTLVSLTASGLVTFEQKVRPQIHGVRFFGGSAREPASYRYPNGSVLVVGGMDKAEKVMSTEYDMAYAQEATELTEGDVESVTTRLRNGAMPYQQFIGDCNPDAPTHWIQQRHNAGRLTLLHSRHEDNPLYWDRDAGDWTEEGRRYVLGTLEALSGVRRDRLRFGRWVAAEGIVYEGYDPAVHLIDRFDMPPEWPRYWSVDFGFTHPFVWQAWAVDPDGRLFRYREIYLTQTLVEDHAKAILRATKGEPRPVAVICDHDAEGRATLERHLGITTTPAYKAVSEGIQALQARLRPAGDGRPRIFFLRDSVVQRDQARAQTALPCSTEEEFVAYVWDTSANRRKGEQPVKALDDGMDTTRYVVADRDLKPPKTRWRAL